ncbi:MAG: hypothetical protein QOE33_3506 [Acidobacteriota bacterium]|nr:hypothetical protein [Acidobacteriota bacterium]
MSLFQTAKPLFVGSIPTAAFFPINNLGTVRSVVKWALW